MLNIIVLVIYPSLFIYEYLLYILIMPSPTILTTFSMIIQEVILKGGP